MGSLVSLVMSDIVDSTRRWNAAEGAMAADLELHDRLVREVVEGAGGSVFKHTGDGMIAVFDDPVAAVGAAAAIQRSIGGAQWQHSDGLQVRAAVHSGVVYERDGDMFGTAVNKLARILSACPSGAVLVSNVVAGLLAERAPEGLGLRAVGEVTLAGFAVPEVVHAVTGAGVEAVGSLAAATHPARRGGELPPIDDELIGRTDELAAIWDALGRTRLVTLVGVGGMGKTRLALEVAAGGANAFADGMWWVDLSAATSADAVVQVANAAVGARETPGRTPVEAWCDRFANKTAVIVIDNCEHVLVAARELVKSLRTAAPDTRVVATSREALGLRGEHLVAIGSLPAGDGAALFIERALEVRPDLDVDANRSLTERICTRLDGIPLAIELAAARCRSLTPGEIDELLDDRFRLLRGGRDGAERHRTLQAAVAWSYSLLDHDERDVFDQMAVFAGGTLVDGVVAVTGRNRFEVVDIVDRLVARSMVVASTTPLGTRYHQLETLRQFAEDRLVEAGSIDQARDRHLEWVRELAHSILQSNGTPGGADGYRRFCVEIDNLRVAVAHATGTGRHGIAHEIVASVAACSYLLPAYEVLDWARPLQLPDGWTDAAAECAAWGALADFYRQAVPEAGPIGGVPERFLTSNRVVGLRHAMWAALIPGRLDEAVELIERLSADTEPGRLHVDTHWLFVQNMRQMVASSTAEMQPAEFDEIGRRGRAALEAARRLGDTLEYGNVALRFAFALEHHAPADALVLAAEAEQIFDQVGARLVRDFALAALQRCSDRTSPSTGEHPTQQLIRLRSAISSALDSGLTPALRILTWSAFGWIADTDPDAALALSSLLDPVVNPSSRDQLRRAGIPLPDSWSEWTQATAHLTVDDGARAIVAALDRVIAAAEAAAAGGGS
jgi:predicted ATPase/class 3 adenylate cyclase